MEKDVINGAQTAHTECSFCQSYFNADKIKDNRHCKIKDNTRLIKFVEVDLYYGLRSTNNIDVLQVRDGTYAVNYCPICGRDFRK